MRLNAAPSLLASTHLLIELTQSWQKPGADDTQGQACNKRKSARASAARHFTTAGDSILLGMIVPAEIWNLLFDQHFCQTPSRQSHSAL